MEISIIRIDKIDGSVLDSILSLYSNEFKEPGQKNPKDIIAMLQNDKYLTLLARQKQDIIGFLLCYMESLVRMAVIEYLVISPRHRRKGHGSRLIDHLKSHLCQRKQGNYTILVECDKYSHSYNKYLENIARLSFYSKNSFNILDVPYYFPLLKKPRSQMYLLVYQNSLEGKDYISSNFVRDYILSIYRNLYGIKSHTDTKLREILNFLCKKKKVNFIELENLKWNA